MSDEPQNDEPARLQLSEVETLRLARAHAETRAVRAEMTLLQQERALFLAKIDPGGVLRALDTRLSAKKTEMLEAQRLERDVRQQVEERLGVNLAQYSYDDVTGMLHELPQPEADDHGAAQVSVPERD